MRNLQEDNQSNKRLVVGSIEVLEDITGEGVKVIKQQIDNVGNNLDSAIAKQNDYWSELSSDRTITPVEKKTIYKEYSNIENTHNSIMQTAETLGYLTDQTIIEYDTAYQNITTYLLTTLKLFDNLDKATNISSRSKFNGYFTSYYDKEFKARVLLAKGNGGGYQDYQFAIGELDSYPTEESDWHDAPPTVPAGKYLWCRTRWVDPEGYSGQWYTFRIQGTNGSYHDNQFAIGSKDDHPTEESDWYDAPPTIPEGSYLWCRQRYVDSNGIAEDWSYYRIDGSNGGWQDTMFASGLVDSYPTDESEWFDAPPEIVEGRYLWQRTRWIQDDTKTEWEYTRLSGASAGYQDYQFAIGTIDGFLVALSINGKTLYINNSKFFINDPNNEGDWHDAPPEVTSGFYLWCRTRWVDENGDPDEWSYFRMSGAAGGYQDYQFAEGDLTSYPSDESAWHDAPPSIAEDKYLWQRTRWVEDGQEEQAWKYTRISGPAGGYQDYQFAEGDLTSYPSDESSWHDAPPSIADGKYLWQRTRWTEEGQAEQAWKYTRISGKAAGYQDYQFAEGDLTTYPSDESSWHDAPPSIAGDKYLWQRTRWVEDGKETPAWTYTRITGPAGGYQDYQFAEGDLTSYPSDESSWHDAPPSIAENKYLWQRTRWVEDGQEEQAWTYTRMSGKAAGYQDYMFAEGDISLYPSDESAWHDAPPSISKGKYLWQRTRWTENGSSGEWTYTRLSGEDAKNVVVEFSIDGETDWHTDFKDGDYYMHVSTDSGSTFTTAAKIVGEDAADVQTKYSETKDGPWHETFTDNDKWMIVCTDGITWSNATKVVGEDAPQTIVEFSIDGINDWHTDFTSGDYYMHVSTDGGTTFTVAAKIVGEDAPEVKTQYSIDGVTEWHDKYTDGDYYMKLSTDDGVTWSDPAKIVGESAPETIVEFSVDGETGWHTGFITGDYFMHVSTDGGTSFTAAAKIVGENAPEVKTQYSIDGVTDWHETFVEGDYYMKLSTDDGKTWSDPAKIVGEDAPQMQTKYSITGIAGEEGNWHFPYADGDYYMITSTDGGKTWSDPMRVVGENAPATLALYSIDGVTDWHDKYTDGDYYMKLSFDGGLNYGDPIQIVGEDGTSVYAQYSTDNVNWHNPPFVEGDLFMRTSSDGETWSTGVRIVGESTGKYIGVKDAYIEPQVNTYFLCISNFVNPVYDNVIINDAVLMINGEKLKIHQLFTKGYVYYCGEDKVWRIVLDRNNYRYLVCINDLKKYDFDLSPAIEEILDDHIEPVKAQVEEHAGEITVINNKLVVIDNNLAKKLDTDDYHIPLNLGSFTSDPANPGEGDFYVYVGSDTTTRIKSNVYVYEDGKWVEKDPKSNQDGAYYMASLNQILAANVTNDACFGAVFAASIYANTAWLKEVHSSIVHISEYGSIETDNYEAGATFNDEGITAASGGKGFKLQDQNGDVPAYMDMNGYAHFGNDVLIDGKMKATNAEIEGDITANKITFTEGLKLGNDFKVNADGELSASGARLENITYITGICVINNLKRSIEDNKLDTTKQNVEYLMKTIWSHGYYAIKNYYTNAFCNILINGQILIYDSKKNKGHELIPMYMDWHLEKGEITDFVTVTISGPKLNGSATWNELELQFKSTLKAFDSTVSATFTEYDYHYDFSKISVKERSTLEMTDTARWFITFD